MDTTPAESPEPDFLVIDLSAPISHKGETWDRLTFPPPTAGIIRTAAGSGDLGSVLQVISEWSGVPAKALEALGPEDCGECSRAVQEAIEPISQVLQGTGDDGDLDPPELPFRLVLKDPISLGSSGTTIKTLELERALAGHMLGVPAQSATPGDFLKLAAKLFQVPPSTIYRLSPRDAAPVLQAAISLFLRFQGI